MTAIAEVFLAARLDKSLIQSDARSAGEKAGSEFSAGFTANLKSLAVGLIGVEGVKEGYKAVIEGGTQLQEVTNRGATAARNAGVAQDAYSAALKRAEDSGAKLGFTSVQIAGAYGTLITRTGNVTDATKELGEAEDVARFKHIDLASAADIVNRAHLGNSKALKDLNIVLPAHATALQTATAVTEYFAKIQGQAADYADSLAGKEQVLKTEFDNAAASLGSRLIPALSTSLGFVIDHGKEIAVAAGAVGGAIGAWKLAGITVETLAAAGQKANSIFKLVTLQTLEESKASQAAAVNAARLTAIKDAQAVVSKRQAVAQAEATLAQEGGVAATEALTLASAELAVAEDAAEASAASLAATIDVGTGGTALIFQAIAAAVLAAGAAIYEAYQHIKPFRDAVNDVAHVVKEDLLVAWQAIETEFKKDVLPEAKKTLTDIKNIIKDNKQTFEDFAKVVELVAGAFIKVLSLDIAGFFKVLGASLQVADAGFLAIASSANAVVQGIKNIIDAGAALGLPGFESAKNTLDGLANSINKAPAPLTNLKDKITDAGGAAAVAAGQVKSLVDQYNDLISAEEAYPATKLGVDPGVATLANNLTGAYNTYQKSIKSVSDAQYNEGQTAKSTAEANVQASRAVTDAQASYRKSVESVLTAEANLTKARQDAQKAIRDEADTVEASSIRLAQAQRQELITRGLDPSNLQRRQAVLDLDNAQKTYNDTVAQANDVQKKGVEGADGVVSAKKSLKDAQDSESKAAQAVTDAYQKQSDTIEAGKRARDQAHDQTQTAIADQTTAKQKYDESKTAVESLSGAHADLVTEFEKQFNLDSGNTIAQMNDIFELFDAAKIMAASPNVTAPQAWAQAKADMQSVGQAALPGALPIGTGKFTPHATVMAKASGGLLEGPGSGTSDNLLIAASPGEFVTNARATAKYLPLLMALNSGIPAYAEGGPVLDITKMGLTDAFRSQINTFMAATGPGGGGEGSVDEIIATANQSNIPHTVTSSYRPGDPGYHGKHMAVDFGDFQYGRATNDALAAWWLKTHGSQLLELIHSPSWFIKNGRVVSPDFYRSVYDEHFNHVHVAASKGALAAAAQAISGGDLGDTNVAQIAAATGKSMGADHKAMLALFEAGLVESGMRNLNYGDRDSLGYLQQRPSQGWPDPMNVAVATRSFLARAMAREGRFGTAGQLAQGVQVSAFPDRYDQRQAEAQALLSRYGFDSGGWLDPGPLNGTGQREAVLTPEESAGLKAAVSNKPVRLDDYTIARLAQAIYNRPTSVEMDGKVVAENSKKAVADMLSQVM